jgi:peptidoglycan/LPS O-acetylase OafA/YrhL
MAVRKKNTEESNLPTHQDNRFDFLRLLAAWLVLFSHSYPLGGWPNKEPLATTLGIDTFGGIGVAIFFVLSGYLVTLSLERSASIVTFVRHRAVRIYPALLVSVFLCAFILGPLVTKLNVLDYFSSGETWRYLKTAGALKIQYALPGVFTETPVKNAVNGSLWSLPYELRCYLALVILWLLPFSLRWKTLASLSFLAMVVLLRPSVPPADPGSNFWGMDYYYSKLGMIFFVGAVSASWREHFKPSIWIGLLASAGAFFMPYGNGQILLFFTGFSLLVLALALNAMWLPVIPKKMGDWSYGTYLYGFPVQQLLAFLGVSAMGVPVFVGASSVITLLLAGLSWHWIEKPALRWR